jgi:hypothetical protein
MQPMNFRQSWQHFGKYGKIDFRQSWQHFGKYGKIEQSWQDIGNILARSCQD